MKLVIKCMLVLAMVLVMNEVKAQTELPESFMVALKADDAKAFAKLAPKDSVNNCYMRQNLSYSLLSMAIRTKAKKCFDYLITKGADVNKSCNGYVPPLMHAAKYGSLDIVKSLVAKGANVKYVYSGDYTPANNMSPAAYAEANKQPEIAAYLKGLN